MNRYLILLLLSAQSLTFCNTAQTSKATQKPSAEEIKKAQAELQNIAVKQQEKYNELSESDKLNFFKDVFVIKLRLRQSNEENLKLTDMLEMFCNGYLQERSYKWVAVGAIPLALVVGALLGRYKFPKTK